MSAPAERLATVIRQGFEDYHARFAQITRRARVRFEQRDWAGARADAVERIELYDECIAECMARLSAEAGATVSNGAVLCEIKDAE